MPSQDDEGLMERLARGELEALGLLLDRHQAAAIRYCRRCLGDHHTAEEVAQEGFLRLVHAAPEYRECGRFTVYLYRVLTRLCIDELRRRNQKKRLAARLSGTPVDELAEELADPRAAAAAPDRQAEGREDVDQLWRELDKLAPDAKACLLLRELEGKSYAAIAGILGCTLENVKVTIHRARKRLAAAMSGEAGPAAGKRSAPVQLGARSAS
ncbi:MAG: RNA polymerase sigma factor [Planctomycetes bacterium]|nr:RNA polymerase sigma factor [Planctomycetota bacterium]